MTEKYDEIRRKLARHQPVAPPPDLLAKLKHQIPEHLTFATERERATVSILRGSAWRIAASIILLAGVGWIGLTTLKTSHAPFVRARAMQAYSKPAPTFAPQLDAAAQGAPAPKNEPAQEAPAPPLERQLARPQIVAALEKKAAQPESPSFAPSEPSVAREEVASNSAKDERIDADATSAAAAQSAPVKTAAATNELDDLKASGELRKETEPAGRRDKALAAAAPPTAPSGMAAPAPAQAAGAAVPERATSAKSALQKPALQANTQPPVAIECTPVAYPAEARKAKAQGVAIVAAVIGPDGKVESTEVIQSLPHGLGRAAEEAVRNCRFQPAMLDGRPIRTRFEVPVRFDLAKGTCVICEASH